jgi:hypothetical protein
MLLYTRSQFWPGATMIFERVLNLGALKRNQAFSTFRPSKIIVLFGVAVSLICSVAFTAPVHAVIADWSPTNSNIITGPTTVSEAVDGVTITSQAFTTEIDGTSSIIFGPFPTNTGFARLQVFGTNTSGVRNPGLGLNSQPLNGINVTGTDFGAGNFLPGFDDAQFDIASVPGPARPSFEFALFSFSAPVSVNAVTVDDASNFGRSIWVASGTTLPDLSKDFVSAFQGFAFSNLFDDATDGPFTHHLTGATDINYLAVGALPSAPFGPLASRGGHFYITGLDFIPGNAEPGPGPTSVPEPSSIFIIASGVTLLAASRLGRKIIINRRAIGGFLMVIRKRINATGH